MWVFKWSYYIYHAVFNVYHKNALLFRYIFFSVHQVTSMLNSKLVFHYMNRVESKEMELGFIQWTIIQLLVSFSHWTASSLSFPWKLWGKTQNKRGSMAVKVMLWAPTLSSGSLHRHLHIMLTVTLPSLLVLCSSPQIYKEKRDYGLFRLPLGTPSTDHPPDWAKYGK